MTATPPAGHEPPPDDLAWAIAAIGTGARLRAVEAPPQHRATGPWVLRLDTPQGHPVAAVLHVADATADPDARRRFRTVAAALELLERHGLAAAPRLLGHKDETEATHATHGDPGLAILQTALDGDSRIPRDPPLARAANFGRAIAAIHAVPLRPTDDLPRRTRSLEGSVDFDALPVPPEDEDRVARIRQATDRPLPPTDTLVHGDLWQGNALWAGADRAHHVGTIDWDQAGAGHPAIDLGTARFDAAVFHGPDHARALLDGYRQAAAAAPDDATIALGDLLAVRCSPPDLRAWLPNFHAQGRTDLTQEQVTQRRDGFVEEALRNLDK